MFDNTQKHAHTLFAIWDGSQTRLHMKMGGGVGGRGIGRKVDESERGAIVGPRWDGAKVEGHAFLE